MALGGGVITGHVALVKYGYGKAATIEGYTVTRDPVTGWRVAARVVLADSYQLAQRGLIFEAPLKAGAFRWPILGRVELHGDRLTAQLGDPLP